MDKKIIKNRLQQFLSEEATPGIKVTADMKKKSGEINKDGVKAIEKDVTSYEKDLKKEGKDKGKMATNKFNYEDGFEKTYHDEMEIMNGQEMLQYDSKPNKEFVDKAKEGMVGSSRMGNENKVGNAEAAWGASSDDFGKDFEKRAKSSQKKRSAETPTLNLRGRDIQADLKDTGHKPYAIEENKSNNNNPQIKESMKRLRFNKDGNKPFNGVGNALKLIPESYKVDKKEFEMTDGNETYRIRWEGTLSEGKAVVLTAADKKLVNEDIQRMKALFGYKSQDTLGLVKGNARIDENRIFGEMLNKTKKLMTESEDIEGQDAEKEAPFEEADVNQAPEAKKHIQGSVSQKDLGGVAPKPKEGNWDEISVPQAADAKKHIEGSVSTEKGTQAPKPKEGHWEDVTKKAPEATEHMESGKSTNKATDKAKVVSPAKAINENEEGEESDADVDVNDDWEKPETDDDSSSETEPTAKDIKGDVPAIDTPSDDEDNVVVPSPKAGAASLLFSKSTGTYWIKGPGLPLAGAKVPDEFMAIASDTSKKSSERAMLIIKALEAQEDEMGGEEEEIDEYGDEHHISTKDAVAGMGAGNVKEYGDEHPVSTADAVKGMKPGAVKESKKAKK